MQCLIHIDADLGPVGVWAAPTAGQQLRHFYPRRLDPGIADRGRLAMAARGAAVPIPVWFAQLAERTPHRDDYALVSASDGTPLVDVLCDYRARWITTG